MTFDVILDPVGLVLEPHYPDDIPKKLLRRMVLSSIWQNYQRGHIPLQDAARRLAELPFVKRCRWAADEIASCFLERRTMREVPWMLQLLDVLREELHFRLFCVSNASEEEMQRLRSQFPSLFARFHATYTSGEEGVGKPSVRFLQLALDKAGIHAHRTLYLDAHDQLESIVAARSLGMHAVLFKPHEYDISKELVAPASSTAAPHQLLNINRAYSSTCPSLPQFLSLISAYRVPSPLHHESLSLHKLWSLPHSTTTREIEAFDGSVTQDTLPIPSSAPAGHRSTALASARRFLLETGAHDPKKLFHYPSCTSEGIRISDNFAQFIMADLLNDTRILPMQLPPDNGLICFIRKNGKINGSTDTMGLATNELDRQFYALDACTYMDIPEDLDTTSIGLSILHKFGRVDLHKIHKVLDKMLEYVSKDDGILQVYFDADRPPIDPVAAANVVFLFHLAKRGHEVEKTERFVQSVLLHRAYEYGTLYYNLGEAFLVAVARLVNRFKEHFTRSGMRSVLVARLQENRDAGLQKSAGNALALAMHMWACWLCGLEQEQRHKREEEKEAIVRLQKGNGGWDYHPYYRYGSNVQSWIGSEGLTTAYALVALQPDTSNIKLGP